eukprot:Hpha_TRINITY_DN16360_c3_g2::TRINITY_DN16360_c3_g2_i1::g.58309::m.58309
MASGGEEPTHHDAETPTSHRLGDPGMLPDPTQHFCVAVLNGHGTLQCTVPTENGQTSTATASACEDLAIFGEPMGVFLQIMFFSPNFPQKCDYSIHGTLELLNEKDELEASVYLGVLEDRESVEKKQRTVAITPHRVRLAVHRIPPLGPNPNEAQLIEEITAVLENPKLNPGKGSLASVMVQHRVKESPLYEKVVGKRFGNSWHAFMKANQETFSLFHYSPKEIQDRKLSPFCKCNEARVVLRKHEQAHDWRAADERSAQEHALAEEGLKQYLTSLLEQRDYDQRELLEVLAGNAHFSHFLSPTFSILMRTLNRHKGTFICSSDPDQPTRVGLTRADPQQAQNGPMIAPRAQAPVPPAHLLHRPATQAFSAPLTEQNFDPVESSRQQQKIRRTDPSAPSNAPPPSKGKGKGKGGFGGYGGGNGGGFQRGGRMDFGERSRFGGYGGGGHQFQQDQFRGAQVMQGGLPGLGGGAVGQSVLDVSDPQLQQVLSQIPGLDQNTTVVVLQQPGDAIDSGFGGQVQYVIQEQGGGGGGGVHLGQGLYLPPGSQQIVVHTDGLEDLHGGGGYAFV